LQGEFLYVYAGNGSSARKAAGAPLSGVITVANGAAGHTDAGLHIFAFVGETLSGLILHLFLIFNLLHHQVSSVSFGSVPTGGGTFIKRLFGSNKSNYKF